MNILDSFQIVDLTHTIHEGIPTWSGKSGFHLEIKRDYDTGVRVQSMKCHAGIGTHMDAPTHFFEGSWNIGDIPLENLIAPVCLLDVRNEMEPDFFVLPHHVEAYEKKYGPIQKHSLVIAQTGWEQFWSNPEQYQNKDASGRMHFPGFSPEAATLLVQKGIVGLGIDTLTPDGSHNTSPGEIYPVHRIVLGAKKYILENLAHLDRMPPSGAYAIVFPPKLRDATEASARVAGLIPKKPAP